MTELGRERSRDQNLAEEMNEETNWRRKRKNWKHPGSQRGGSSKNGKKEEENCNVERESGKD